MHSLIEKLEGIWSGFVKPLSTSTIASRPIQHMGRACAKPWRGARPIKHPTRWSDVSLGQAKRGRRWARPSLRLSPSALASPGQSPRFHDPGQTVVSSYLRMESRYRFMDCTLVA